MAAFGQRALELKMDIKTLVHSPAHPGIQKIQNIFREKAARLYHWSKKSAIPADNNRAERELRPLVIARKISFGSQSEQGALTREILRASCSHSVNEPPTPSACSRAPLMRWPKMKSATHTSCCSTHPNFG